MLLALLLQAGAPVAAPCPATPAPLPKELAGWDNVLPVAASANVPTPLPIGRGAKATLLPAANVTLAIPTDRTLPPGSSNAVFSFLVPAMGRYRVALGRGVWIDVISQGRALPTAAHGHGPSCSPVRKMVDYDLQPGRYLLQIVGSDRVVLPLMIARIS